MRALSSLRDKALMPLHLSSPHAREMADAQLWHPPESRHFSNHHSPPGPCSAARMGCKVLKYLGNRHPAGLTTGDWEGYSATMPRARGLLTAIRGRMDWDQEQLKAKLAELELEHRDLDDVINQLINASDFDQIKVGRLKKRKLALKDQITTLRGRLIPDIIA